MNLSLPYIIATWFGSGLIKPAPGTWGSLAALPLLLPVSYYFGPYGTVIIGIFLGILGYFSIPKLDLAEEDPPSIVIDEVVGMFVTFLAVQLTPVNIILGFALFRLFDIIKPWPVCYIDKKIKGAAGIMLDDIVAGVFAAAGVWLVQYFFFG